MQKSHYDETYFEYQNTIGMLSAKANKYLFSPYISSNDNVVDFGSGGGYFLSLFNCKEKIGVEINDAAIKISDKLGIKTVPSVLQLQDNWADVIISSHTLEHCHNPLDEIQKLKSKLKKGGKFILIVPCEKKLKYRPNDMNQHLYTWCEMNLGNLFATAGYKIEKVEEIKHRFPPYSNKLLSFFGDKIFYLIARLYGSLRTKITQVRIVAVND
jgi:SAM-dependent methyltransferase